MRILFGEVGGAVRRYRIEQPTSCMHGWIVDATVVTDTLAGHEITYLAFEYEGQGYGVPLDWAALTDQRPKRTTHDRQLELTV